MYKQNNVTYVTVYPAAACVCIAATLVKATVWLISKSVWP